MSIARFSLSVAGMLGVFLCQYDRTELYGQDLQVVAGRAELSDQVAEKRIEEALERECNISVVESPMLDLFKKIEREFDINVELDTRALDSVGIGTDTPITRRIKGISLHSALQLMLRDLELTWMVRNGTLLVTTPEEAEASLVLQVYEVSDIVLTSRLRPLVHQGRSNVMADFDSLINVITTSVQPESWDEVGGPASIEALAYMRKNVLVVSHRWEAHEQIAQLLDKLRDVQANQVDEAGGKTQKAVANSKLDIYVQVYPIIGPKAENEEELAELVELALGSDTWDEPKTSLDGIAKTLVVRHRADVHNRVQQLLRNLGAIPDANGLSGVGQSGGGFFSVDTATSP